MRSRAPGIRKLAAVLTLLAAMATVGAVPTFAGSSTRAAQATSGTVVLASEPGDPTGGGVPHAWDAPGNATLTLTGTDQWVQVHAVGGTPNAEYWIALMAPTGAHLHPGLYTNTGTTSSTGYAALSVWGGGSGGCGDEVGRFDVQSIQVGSGGAITSLHVTFQNRCTNWTRWNFGEVNVSLGSTAETRMTPSHAWWPDTYVGQPVATLPVTVSNHTSSSEAVGTAAVEGHDADEFTVGTDTCSGTTLAAGARCLVDIRFQPSRGGPLEAQLSIPVGGVTRTTQLDGAGIAGTTALDLQSEPGDPVGGGQTFGYGPGDAIVRVDGSFRSVVFEVEGDDDETWTGIFRAPRGDILQPGTYSADGLMNIDNGTYCDSTPGSFTVDDIVDDPATDALRMFSVSFHQHCGGQAAALNGSLDYQVASDLTPPHAVSGLVATRTKSAAQLSWTNPNDGDFAFVMVRWRAETWFVGDPNAGRFGWAGPGTSAALTGLPKAKTVTVELWALDSSGNVSPGITGTLKP